MNVRLQATLILAVLFIFVSSSNAVEKKDLLGLWLFDEDKGTVARDFSGNGHDGEILGNVERVKGQFGGAFSFPGQPTSFVSIPHDAALDITTFSITAWIKYKVTGRQFQVIVTKGSEATTYGYYLIVYAAPPQFNIAGFTPVPQDWQEAFGTTDVRDDQWHHLAGTYDKKTLRFYLDGEEQGSLAVSRTPEAIDTPLAIGAQHDGFWPAEGIAPGGVERVASSEIERLPIERPFAVRADADVPFCAQVFVRAFTRGLPYTRSMYSMIGTPMKIRC